MIINQIITIMKSKHLLLLLLMAVFAPLAMNAQQTLPYEYGFENNNLSTDGWALTASNTSTGINNSNYRTGSYGFTFDFSTVSSTDAYLMSPILSGGTRGVNVSFYAKARSSNYLDHFQIGYTTDETVTNPSSFTYGSTVTTTTSWEEYTAELPARTVRVAIKYDTDNYNDGWELYLDDFTFTPVSSCATPTELAVNYTEGETTATVSWTSEAANFNIDVNGTITAITDNSYTLNIEPATTYTIKVQADCGEEQSGWASTSFFSGCTGIAIPYAYGFEDAGAMDCWSQVDTEISNGYLNASGNTYANTGNGCYYFSSYYGTTDPQYLISPELSGTENGVHVEFWYRKGPDAEESFKVGYSTTTNDVSSFQWDAEVTSLKTTYQQYKVNYMAPVKYVAIQYTGSDSYYVFIDDITFTEAPTCLEPTNVVVSNETTTGATISWTAGASETAWDIFVTDDATVEPDDTTTPTVAGTETNPYSLTDLDPATIYYVYVRAICNEDEVSVWSSPAIFNTECNAMALPYNYGFEDPDLPVCWNTIVENTSYSGINVMAPTTSSTKVLAFHMGMGTSQNPALVAVLPKVDEAYPLNQYQITFDACYANMAVTAGKLGIGIMTDPADFSTFTLIEEVNITVGYPSFGTYNVWFNSYTGSGRYIAIRDIYTETGYVFVDNIEVTELPACLPPTNLTVRGGKNAVVTWAGNAESFDIAYSEDNTVDPADNIVDNTTGNTFNLGEAVNLTEGDYYVWVRANCGTDGYSDWTSPFSFHVGYCTPNPTSHDVNGITGVSFGTGDYVVTNGDGSASLPASAPYYGDYTSMIGAVQAGVESTIAITTGTGSFPYTFVIWVDLDNSMSFEDNDILYIGKASSGNGTLNATITIPATQATGDYRMRIYGADKYFNNFYGNGTTNWEAAHDPCSSGDFRHAHDYTLRVLEAPSCFPAGEVTVAPESITTTSAVISWTNNNGDEATYTVMQGETVLTANAVDSYLLEDLTAATTYPAGTFTIISDCDETAVVNVPAFTTLCEDITTLPWSEDFEGFEINTVPMCWDNSASTSYISNSSSSPNCIWGVVTVNDNKMIKMENYWAQNGTALINTPTIVLPADGAYQLTFDYAHNASCGAFAVKVSTDNGTTFTELASYDKGSGSSHTNPGEFTPATISLANYAGESIILQFFANANRGNGAIFVDNVEISSPTFTKKIFARTGDDTPEDPTDDGGWNLIASPVGQINPGNVGNMISINDEDFDLYRFNQSAVREEWENYKADNFDLELGRGYLYSNHETVDLIFSGVPLTSTEETIVLEYDGNAVWAGWNLVGNPFADVAYLPERPYYTLNDAGTEVQATTGNSIEAMEGIFVVAEEEGETLTFSTIEPAKSAHLALNLSQGRVSTSSTTGIVDRAIVHFGKGRQLPKFQLNPNHTKVYIPMEGKDYAVVNAEEMGEMPVSFKAEKSGTYTFSANAEEVSFSYLHLIDNMTGADVDLLQTPSYTFNVQTTDYANRFKLVFATGNNSNDDNFAFFSNGSFIINNEGEATLQVIDVKGRIVSSKTINGSTSVNVDAAAGVYMLRLVNGDNTKVQKVVVK